MGTTFKHPREEANDQLLSNIDTLQQYLDLKIGILDAGFWLFEPQPALDHATPIHLIAKGKIQKIIDAFEQEKI